MPPIWNYTRRLVDLYLVRSLHTHAQWRQPRARRYPMMRSEKQQNRPASRQLQDKVGGVAERGEHAMKNIADLLILFLARSPTTSDTKVRLWPKIGIAPAWPILSASCRPTIKTSTAGVRGDRSPIGFLGPLGHEENAEARPTRSIFQNSHFSLAMPVRSVADRPTVFEVEPMTKLEHRIARRSAIRHA